VEGLQRPGFDVSGAIRVTVRCDPLTTTEHTLAKVRGRWRHRRYRPVNGERVQKQSEFLPIILLRLLLVLCFKRSYLCALSEARRRKTAEGIEAIALPRYATKVDR
jgi:hypothetical protein